MGVRFGNDRVLVNSIEDGNRTPYRRRRQAFLLMMDDEKLETSSSVCSAQLKSHPKRSSPSVSLLVSEVSP